MVSEEDLHEVDGGVGFGDGYSGWANSSRFLNVLLRGHPRLHAPIYRLRY